MAEKHNASVFINLDDEKKRAKCVDVEKTKIALWRFLRDAARKYQVGKLDNILAALKQVLLEERHPVLEWFTKHGLKHLHDVYRNVNEAKDKNQKLKYLASYTIMAEELRDLVFEDQAKRDRWLCKVTSAKRKAELEAQSKEKDVQKEEVKRNTSQDKEKAKKDRKNSEETKREEDIAQSGEKHPKGPPVYKQWSERAHRRRKGGKS